MTLLSAVSSSRPTSSSSAARKAASPSRAKTASIGSPSLASSSASASSAGTPSAAAASRAARDLPAPMKPMKTRAGFSAATRCAPRTSTPQLGRASPSPPADPLAVPRHGLEHVVDVVAAELLAVGAGQDEGDHGLPHDAGRRDSGRVGALAQGVSGLVRGEVDRAQRLGQRGQRLHRRAHDDRLAGGHAALEAPGVVGLAVEAALVAEEDLVVGVRARAPGDVEGVADGGAL